MEIIWIVLGAICIVAGFIGTFLPVIPGLPISYAGLIFLQLTPDHPFTTRFLVLWAAIAIGLTVLDNFAPSYGAKKFGGSPYGIWGSMIGLIIGAFVFPPFGIIIGPIAGAFIGEIISGQKSDKAFKAALGSFAGFFLSTVIKVIAAGIMGWYFFTSI